MLSKQQVRDRLKTGEIRIGYSFDISASLLIRAEPPETVDPRKQQSFATKSFERSFFGDRLAIRLGPIVLSHTHKRVRGRKNFKNSPYVFDLRETAGAMLIMPDEGLTVSSIENIALGTSTAAIILPRLSLATAGVVTASTYIDPCWDGILQIYIKNSTRHVYELKFGESIAICRFYQVSVSESADELKDVFTKKSHHYALNWGNILDTDHDPQPLRKSPVKDIWYRRLRRTTSTFLREHWGYVIGASIASMVVAFLVGLGAFYEKLNHIRDLEAAITMNKTLTDSLQSELKQLRAKQVSMGEVDVVIPANTTTERTEISLDRAYSPLLIVRVDPGQPDRSVGVQASLFADRQRSENTIVRITATRPAADGNPLPIRVRWIVGSQ